MLIISGFFLLLALITKDETWVGLTAACLVMPDGPSGMGPGLTRCFWRLVSGDWVRDGNIFQAELLKIFPEVF